MLKIVLDTNVLVSGLIRPESPPDLILLFIFNSQARLYVSEEIFAEYSAVLKRDKFKKYLTPAKVEAFLKDLKKIAVLITPPKLENIIKADPADNKFLECALEAQADFLITGNTRHFSFKKFHQTRIISPAQFIDQLLTDIS